MKLRKYTIFYKGFNKSKILALAKLKMQSTLSGAFLIAKKINCVIIKKKIIFARDLVADYILAGGLEQ